MRRFLDPSPLGSALLTPPVRVCAWLRRRPHPPTAMRTAKEYGAANVEVFNESAIEDSAESGKKTLWIVVSSDRGLCGGIHSSVSKMTKRTLNPDGAETGPDAEIPVIILGDKPKQQLGRAMPNNVRLSFNQIGRNVPTFADACAIADQIEELDLKYDNVKIIYNRVRLLYIEAAPMGRRLRL